MECVRPVSGGVLVDVHVVPNSRKESFSYDGYTRKLKVKINAQAVEGKANKRLIEVFKEVFGASEVVSGAASRSKVVFIPKKTADEVILLIKGKTGD